MASKVVLIGGVGCSGKSVLARSLMSRQQMPYFSVDHLMMGLYRSRPGCGFHPEDSAEKIAGVVWPIVEAMVMTNIENQHSTVYEGFQLLPQHMMSIAEEYRAQCISLCMGLSADYIEREFGGAIPRYRSAVEQRDFSEERLATLQAANAALKARCQQADVAYFEVTDSFEQCQQQALAFVERQLG